MLRLVIFAGYGARLKYVYWGWQIDEQCERHEKQGDVRGVNK